MNKFNMLFETICNDLNISKIIDNSTENYTLLDDILIDAFSNVLGFSGDEFREILDSRGAGVGYTLINLVNDGPIQQFKIQIDLNTLPTDYDTIDELKNDTKLQDFILARLAANGDKTITEVEFIK